MRIKIKMKIKAKIKTKIKIKIKIKTKIKSETKTKIKVKKMKKKLINDSHNQHTIKRNQRITKILSQPPYHFCPSIHRNNL